MAIVVFYPIVVFYMDVWVNSFILNIVSRQKRYGYLYHSLRFISSPPHLPTDRLDYVCPITDYWGDYFLFPNACIWNKHYRDYRNLLNSIYAYVILLIGSTILINGVSFLVFTLFNLALFPIIFVCSFRLEIHRYNKICQDEEQD